MYAFKNKILNMADPVGSTMWPCNSFCNLPRKSSSIQRITQCAADRARCMQTVYYWLNDWSIHDTTCVLNNYVTVKMQQWIMELEAWRTIACIKVSMCIYIYIYCFIYLFTYIYICRYIKVLQKYTNRTTQASPFPAPLCPDSSVKNVSVSPLCLSVWAKHVALRGSFFFKKPTKKLKSFK